MAGIGVAILYDPTGKPFIGLTVDSGMTFVQIWIGDKSTAVHNVAEINRQLKAATADLMQTPDKLIEVKGSLNGLHDQPGRVTPQNAAGRPTVSPRRPRA